MTRGEVYLAELAPRSGSEQQGRRLVIVVSHDGFNTVLARRSVIVVPISTSAAQMGRGPTFITLPAGACGLKKDSVALCHQVTTLDRAKLVHRIGALEGRALLDINGGLRAALQLFYTLVQGTQIRPSNLDVPPVAERKVPVTRREPTAPVKSPVPPMIV